MTSKNNSKKTDHLLSQNKIQFFYPYPSARQANDPKYNFLQLKFEKKNSQSTLNNIINDETSPKKQEKSLQKYMQFYQSCSNSNLVKQLEKLENTGIFGKEKEYKQQQQTLSPRTQREQINEANIQQRVSYSGGKENLAYNDKNNRTKDQVLGKILTPNDLQNKLNQYFKVYQQMMNNSQQKIEKEIPCHKPKKSKKQLTINPQEIEQSYNKEKQKERPLSSKTTTASWKPELGIAQKNSVKKDKKSEQNNSYNQAQGSKSSYSIAGKNQEPSHELNNSKTFKSQIIDSKKSTLTSTTPRNNQILAISQSHQFLDLSSPNRVDQQQIIQQNSAQKGQKIVRNNNQNLQSQSQSQPIIKNPIQCEQNLIFKNQLKHKSKYDDQYGNEGKKNQKLQSKSNSCKNSTKKCIEFSTRDSSKCQEGLMTIMARTKGLLDHYMVKEKVWKKEKHFLVQEIQRLNQIIKNKEQQQQQN